MRKTGSLDEAGLPGGLQLVAEGRGGGPIAEAGDLDAVQGLAVHIDLLDVLALAGGGAGRDGGGVAPGLVGQGLGGDRADLDVVGACGLRGGLGRVG